MWIKHGSNTTLGLDWDLQSVGTIFIMILVVKNIWEASELIIHFVDIRYLPGIDGQQYSTADLLYNLMNVKYRTLLCLTVYSSETITEANFWASSWVLLIFFMAWWILTIEPFVRTYCFVWHIPRKTQTSSTSINDNETSTPKLS